MNWQNNDFFSDEENDCKSDSSGTKECSPTIQELNEQKRLRQLQSIQNPKNDKRIQSHLSIVSKFGDLLTSNNKEERAIESILTKDCEIFLFNLGEIKSVQYASTKEEFTKLYQEFQLIQRDVKEVFIDKEKQTVLQICFCRIFTEKDKSTMDQFSFEVIKFKDDKISKYRASFGVGTDITEFQNPFEPSKKDQMLAKVKELNYAWAGEPDLEKIASLLHESVEYKIWSWEDMKAFTFYKQNFATDFKNIENNYALKCVVPYEVYSEGQFIFGTYVYHLEDKKTGKKFIWLSTCIYSFDKNLSIVKVVQQGELHADDEVLIPFIGSSKEDLMQLVQGFFEFRRCLISEWTLVNNDKFQFSFEMSRLGHSRAPNTGTIRGFNEFEKLLNVITGKHGYVYHMKNVDIYYDCYGSSYDTVIMVGCGQGHVKNENFEHSDKEMNFYNIRKVCFENGKVAKAASFVSEIPEKIPSPYDDPSFSAMNIKSRSIKPGNGA